MLIYKDVFTWDGWGGALKLASGKCYLRIYDLNRAQNSNLTLLKPIVVVVTDLPQEEPPMKQVSIRSCAGHIATLITEKFQISPDRMVFVEYYPQKTYGQNSEHVIAERFDSVDFNWQQGKALHPKWRPLSPTLTQTISKLMKKTDDSCAVAS